MASSAAAICTLPAAQLRDVSLRSRVAGRCGAGPCPSGAALRRCQPRAPALTPRSQIRAAAVPQGAKDSPTSPQTEPQAPAKSVLRHIGTGVAAMALVLSLAAPAPAVAARGVVPPDGNEDILLEEGAQTTGSSGAPGVGQGIKEPLRGVQAAAEAKASDGAKRAKDTVQAIRQAPGAKAAEAVKSEVRKLSNNNKGVVEGVKGKVNEIKGDVQGKAGEAARALQNPFSK